MVFDLTSNVLSNYSIVGGTTEPDLIPHNTIWVNTNKPITDHIFSNTYPSDPCEGFLFIHTNWKKYVDSFSVSEPNKIMVYVICAKQYINGAWKSVSVTRYYDDKSRTWWDGDLFNIVVTDGFDVVKPGLSCSVSSGNKVCNIKVNSQDSSNSGAVRLENQIDLTGWNCLKSNISVDGPDNLQIDYTFNIIKSDVSGNETVASKSLSVNSTSAISDTMDISSVDGPHIIEFRFSRNLVGTAFNILISEFTLL